MAIQGYIARYVGRAISTLDVRLCAYAYIKSTKIWEMLQRDQNYEFNIELLRNFF